MVLDIQDVIKPSLPPAEVFKAYDIRGVVGESGLTPENVQSLGLAIGALARTYGQTTLVVARDTRLSGSVLQSALVEGMLLAGCDVIDIGVAPTPALYFATHHLRTLAGVMITASHNPPQYNGFKIVLAGRSLTSTEINQLAQLDQLDVAESQGEYSQYDIREAYSARIQSDVTVKRSLKVVVDCGNGAAAQLAPALFTKLGCEVVPLFCEFNGHFPNHMPDPSRPENLSALIAEVKNSGADIGLAFDGDGDRLAVIDSAGNIIWPDRVMMAFVEDVLSRAPGATVVLDVKSSRLLVEQIQKQGGQPLIWKSGHSLMKAKMRETQALLGGELSGHVFFKDRWYGFDDGLYAAARLLEILSRSSKSSYTYFAGFPEDITTPEILIPLQEGEGKKLVQRIQSQAGQFSGKALLIDGLRVDYADGWGLVRASNTMPYLTLRFEAESVDSMARIQQEFKMCLQQVCPDLTVPF